MDVLSPSALTRLWVQFTWADLGPLSQQLFMELHTFCKTSGNQVIHVTGTDDELPPLPPGNRLRVRAVSAFAERYELLRTKYLIDQLRARNLAWCTTTGRRKKGERTEFDVHGDGIHDIAVSERMVRIPALTVKGGVPCLPNQYVTVHTICAACRVARERNKDTNETIRDGRLIMLDRARRGIYSTDEDAKLLVPGQWDLRPRLVRLHQNHNRCFYFVNSERVDLRYEWDGGFGIVPTVELSGSELHSVGIQAPPFLISLLHWPYYQLSIQQLGTYHRLYLRAT